MLIQFDVCISDKEVWAREFDSSLWDLIPVESLDNKDYAETRGCWIPSTVVGFTKPGYYLVEDIHSQKEILGNLKLRFPNSFESFKFGDCIFNDENQEIFYRPFKNAAEWQYILLD